jgi:diketogulonate reductase-like aldo/keto reductase
MGAARTIPSLSLSDGIEIPQIGLDLYPVPPEETQRAVELALELGYRHIDSAAAYRNEREAGAALAASALPRDDYFVTTKLWCSHLDQDSTLATFEASLERLGLDRVDLCLIYWPVPTGGRFIEIWRALERIREQGLARTIGVSNFRIEDLDLLGREAGVRPVVNQVELHPYSQENDLLCWHAEHGIATAAWSPLAQGELLEDERAVVRLAEGHGKTLSQVVLRWHLQLGHIVIPNSDTPERVRENIEVFDFALSDEELAVIAELDSDRRVGTDVATPVP